MVQNSKISATPKESAYRPEIDGLRAIAVLLVILFHAEFSGFSGGFIGVDIFFVISGYLITGIILQDLELNRFSLIEFYQKRARRILPPLLVMIVITLAAGLILFPPMQMQWLSQSALSALLFASNIYFMIKGGDYFAAEAFYPLKHTWSLGVEEQFYFVFPIILVLLKVSGPRLRNGLILGLMLASLGYCLIVSEANAGHYYNPLTRAWELLAGSLCALIKSKHLKRGGDGLALVGLCLIIGTSVLFNEQTPFPSLYTLLPILGTAMVILFAVSNTRIARGLSWRPFVQIGKLSYGLYLWHFPIFIFAQYYRIDTTAPDNFLMLLGLMSALTYASYRFIEVPIRYNISGSFKQVVAASVLLGASMALAGGAYLIHIYGGLPARGNIAGLPDAYFQNAGKIPRFTKGIHGRPCTKTCAALNIESADETWLLVGDSHSNDFRADFLQAAQHRNVNLHYLIIPNCNYAQNTCEKGYNRLAAAMTDLNPTDIMFVSSLAKGPRDQKGHLNPDTTDLLKSAMNAGAHIWFFQPRVRLSQDPVRMALSGALNDIKIDPSWADATKDTELAELHDTSESFQLINQSDTLIDLGCGQIECFNGHTQSGLPLYRDNNHLTTLGSNAVFDTFIHLLDTKK